MEWYSYEKYEIGNEEERKDCGVFAVTMAAEKNG